MDQRSCLRLVFHREQMLAGGFRSLSGLAKGRIGSVITVRSRDTTFAQLWRLSELNMAERFHWQRKREHWRNDCLRRASYRRNATPHQRLGADRCPLAAPGAQPAAWRILAGCVSKPLFFCRTCGDLRPLGRGAGAFSTASVGRWRSPGHHVYYPWSPGDLACHPASTISSHGPSGCLSPTVPAMSPFLLERPPRRHWICRARNCLSPLDFRDEGQLVRRRLT